MKGFIFGMYIGEVLVISDIVFKLVGLCLFGCVGVVWSCLCIVFFSFFFSWILVGFLFFCWLLLWVVVVLVFVIVLDRYVVI